MKKILSLLTLVLLASLTATAQNITPQPSTLKTVSGNYTLPAAFTISVTGLPDSLKAEATKFAAEVNAAGMNASLTESAEGANVALNVSTTGMNAEGYNLGITTDGVTIESQTAAGFYYAFRTLKRLLPDSVRAGLPTNVSSVSLPCLTIKDKPRFTYRGFMLDVSRHFFTVEEVKRMIDLMAEYKMNKFHWHLTDDQGWRIEIPEYPKLTEVGAVRKSSLTLNNNDGGGSFYDDTEYGRGCYYTLAQLREVADYAKARNIDILPEVDLPGHMVAAITSYPWLSCDSTQAYNDSYQPLGTPKEVRVNAGVSRDVLNVSDPRVIEFLKTVLGHVAEVFPYKYIHLGGDECPTAAWDATESVQTWMQEKGFTSSHEIQPWLVEELGTWLSDNYGKGVTVWNELVTAGYWKSEYKTKPVVFSYANNVSNLIKTVTSQGFQTIATQTTPMYFDLLQASASDMEFDAPYSGGYGDAWVNTVQNVYNYNPASQAGDNANLVIGAQGTLWTESCGSEREMQYVFFPRLIAASEMTWIPYSQRSYSNFITRLQRHRAILDANHICYAPYVFDDPEYTATEKALLEADSILAQSKPGMVGYPAQSDYDALSAAAETLRAATDDAAKLTALQNAVTAYKATAITMPEEGKYYEIVNASTYYKKRFNGSSLYLNNTGFKIHYTPQLEPEEVFSFSPAASGKYYIKALAGGKYLVMANTNNGTVSASTTDSTALQIRAARKANAKYDYRPGAVNLRGRTTVLAANISGQAIASTDSTLSYPGTWYIREITDFTPHLLALVSKAEHIIATATPGAAGEPTQEALDFLLNSIVTPAAADAATGNVTKTLYDKYVALYSQYLDMPRNSALDVLSESKYYKLQNAYFTAKYAVGNASTNAVDIKDSGSTEAYDWYLRKNADGTFSIYNRATNTAAYVSSTSVNTAIKLGKEYKWTLFEYENTGDNVSGLAICETTGANSWYSNPAAWSYVLLKPYTWGAALWNFVESGDIPTGIDAATTIDTQRANTYYDLQGRRVAQPTNGIYINGNGKKILY